MSRSIRKQPGGPRVSRSLQRLLRNIYQAEPLEQRILLSADPAAAVSQMLWPEGHAGQTALADATVIAWEDVAGSGSSEQVVGAEGAGPGSFAVDGAAFDEVMSQTRAAFMDSALAAQDAAYARFMDEVLASPGDSAGPRPTAAVGDTAGALVLGVPLDGGPEMPASLSLGDLATGGEADRSGAVRADVAALAADRWLEDDRFDLSALASQAPAEGLPGLVVDPSATLAGSGTWAGAVLNEGTLSPGYSPGVQTLGSYVQASDAALVVELAGTGLDLFDRIVVSDLAELDGALEVVLLDDFMPQVGDEFRILTYGSVQGTFSTITGLGIGAGLFLEFVQDAAGITLVAREVAAVDTRSLGDGAQSVRLDTFTDLGSSFLSVQSTAGAMLRNVVQLPTARVIVDGGAGRDVVTLGDLDLGATALEVLAETIELPDGSDVTSAADIVLTAADFSQPALGSDAATLTASASVLIGGSVVTTGRLVAQASAGADAAVASRSTFDLGLDATLDAQARVASTATVTASAFLLQALADGAYRAAAVPMLSATGQTVVDVSQTAQAMVGAGATLHIGRGSAREGSSESLIVDAGNDADVSVSLFSQDSLLTTITGLDLVRSRIVLDKTTSALLGSVDLSAATVVVAGQQGQSAGPVAVRADSGGSVEAVIVSSFLGTHALQASDDTQATAAHAQVDAQALNLRAVHDAQYLGRAKAVTQSVAGDLYAGMTDSAFIGGGLHVQALDQGSYGARAADLDLDLAVIPVGLSLGKSLASNVIDRSVKAEVVRGDVQATDVVVEARNEQEISARANAQTVRDNGNLGTALPGKSLTFGGVMALNHITGALVAQVVDSELVTTGDVTVTADNAAAIDARTEAGSTNTGGSGGAVGAAIAFNAIGARLDGFLSAGLDVLTGGGWQEDETAGALAQVTGTRLQVGGDLTVEAVQALGVNATVSNLSEATSMAVFGAAGMAASGMLASNRVHGQSRALLQKTPVGGLARVLGDLVVDARDEAAILSNTRLVADSTTTNDGGVSLLKAHGGVTANGIRVFDTDEWAAFTTDLATSLGVTVAQLGMTKPAYLDSFPKSLEERGAATKFVTSDKSLRTVAFDDRVEVVDGEDLGRIYRYMGKRGTFTPATEDYANRDLWQEVLTTRETPSIADLGQADPIAVGGVFVRNVVHGGAIAEISDMAELRAGRVSVMASSSARLAADVDSYVSASARDDLGLAVNGTVAVNQVLGGAVAEVLRSTVRTEISDVVVHAENTSTLNATNRSVTQSGADGVGVMLAFNTIGWEADDLFSMAIDALVGTEFGNIDANSTVTARVSDSTIEAAGDIGVQATQAARLSANLGNEATSAASSLFNSASTAVGAVLTLNRVASQTRAEILDSSLSSHGHVSIVADQVAGIEAHSDLMAISSATNGLGSSLVGGLIDTLTDRYDYTTKSGKPRVQPGTLVRVASDHEAGGIPGGVYKYVGPASATVDTAIDLGVDSSGEPPETVLLIDLSAEDFSDIDRWVRVSAGTARAALPDMSVADSDSTAVGGLVVLNDLRGGATARVLRSQVLAGSAVNAELEVRAIERSDLKALSDGIVTSSGGSAFGQARAWRSMR